MFSLKTPYSRDTFFFVLVALHRNRPSFGCTWILNIHSIVLSLLLFLFLFWFFSFFLLCWYLPETSISFIPSFFTIHNILGVLSPFYQRKKVLSLVRTRAFPISSSFLSIRRYKGSNFERAQPSSIDSLIDRTEQDLNEHDNKPYLLPRVEIK